LPDGFEVGIVGAGLGGSVCANVLGKAGISVALFDNSYPREKPCGGLIDQRVVKEFNIPKQLLQNEVKSAICERFGFRIKLSVEPSGFLVLRKDFDYFLLQKALKNRSVAFFNERVEQITKANGWLLRTNKNRCIRVKFLIGADGCPSLVRKKILSPIPSEFLITTVGYNFPCSSRYIEKAFEKNTLEAYYSSEYVRGGGFIWIFPKKNIINVGIGSAEAGKTLAHSLDTFIFSHVAGERLRHLNGEPYTHLIPTILREEFYRLPCSGQDWALVGDAAAHVNPINGAGIYYAMKGGMLCGAALLHGDLRLFDTYWREEYGDELRFGARKFSRYYSNLGFFTWLRFILGNSPFQFLFLNGIEK